MGLLLLFVESGFCCEFVFCVDTLLLRVFVLECVCALEVLLLSSFWFVESVVCCEFVFCDDMFLLRICVLECACVYVC